MQVLGQTAWAEFVAENRKWRGLGVSDEVAEEVRESEAVGLIANENEAEKRGLKVVTSNQLRGKLTAERRQEKLHASDHAERLWGRK